MENDETDIRQLLAVISNRLNSIESVRFPAIERKLDKINGSVHKHDEWIAGRTPVCAWHEDNVHRLTDEAIEARRDTKKVLDRLQQTVVAHDSQFAKQTGSWAGVQTTLQTIVSAITLVAVMWMAIQTHAPAKQRIRNSEPSQQTEGR